MEPSESTLSPSPFPFVYHTCSEVGEERDEFGPINPILPGEVREIFFFFLLKYMCYIYNVYNYLHRLWSPLGTSLLVDLLGSHDWTKMEELWISPRHILQVELSEGIMGFPVAGW